MNPEYIERIAQEIDAMVRKDEVGEVEVEQLLQSILKVIVEENTSASGAGD